MVNKIAEHGGTLWQVEGVCSDYFTGKESVIISRHLTMDQILDKGCTYGAVAKWVVSIEDFRENFRWHNEVSD